MTAPAVAPTIADPRFASRLRAVAAVSADRPRAADGDARSLVEGRLYADIGDFLATHRLSPTPAHYEIVHIYLTDPKSVIAGEIGAMIAASGTLDRDRVAALVRPKESGPQALADLAARLEAQLAECLSVTDRSQISARDYGDALDIAQTRLDSDPGGTLAHIAGLTREVVSTTRRVETELKETRRETERLRGDLDLAREAAEHDHLTGLPNRRGLERRIAALVEKRDPARNLAVALCDIDDFKRINDVHGHQTGDRVLRFVGRFLSEALSDDACVARYGGEEFAVLIDGRTPYEAMLLLDDVRDRLAARSLVNQDTGAPIGRITFSAGIAGLDTDGVRAMGEADAALYKAKRGGKNSVALAPVKRV